MVIEYLLKFGYSNNDIENIYKRCVDICKIDSNVIDKRIKFLSSLGYSEENIRKMILINPKMLCVKDSDITNVIYTLVNLKYDYNDIIKMTLKNPLIYMCKDSDILLRYYDLMSLGYHHDEIKEITIEMSSLYGNGYNSFKEKIDYMKELGFPLKVIKKITKEKNLSYIDLYSFKSHIQSIGYYGFSMEDIISMAYDYPNILFFESNMIGEKIKFFYSLDLYLCNNIIKNNARLLKYTNEYLMIYIDLFKEYNFSMEEIREIIKMDSKVFNIDLKDMRMKLELFRQMRISKYVVKNPNILFRDIDIMYSRFEYLKSIDESVGSKKIDLLLKSNDDFSKIYGISACELLDSYNDNNLYAESIKRMVRRKK